MSLSVNFSVASVPVIARRLGAAALLLVLGFGLGACGKDTKATLRMVNSANNTSFSLRETGPAMFATPSAASEFKMKLIAAYLAEDIDSATGSNVGQTSMFYLNPDCADDIMHCDVSGGTAEDGAPMSRVVTSYFDFAQPTAVVNAALNAQARDITPATYKYVRLEFCKYNQQNATNIVWGNGTTVVGQAFQRNNCTVNSAQLSPPITVEGGDEVTVSVAYDYSASLSTGADATGDNCSGSGSGMVCFTLPTFTPSASK